MVTLYSCAASNAEHGLSGDVDSPVGGQAVRGSGVEGKYCTGYGPDSEVTAGPVVVVVSYSGPGTEAADTLKCVTVGVKGGTG